MSAAVALLRADLWRTRNSIREIARKPSRAIMWAFFALWLGWLAFARASHGTYIFDVRGATATIAGSAALLFVAIGVATAGRSALATPLDLVMLERSAIGEGTILAWLSARTFFTRSLRGFVVLFALALAHTRSSALDAALAFVGVAMLAHFVAVPAMLLRARAPHLVTAIASLLALAGLGGLIVGWLAPASDPIVGPAFAALWSGSPLAFAVLYGIALLCWLSAFGARDIFCDLYERARAGATLRERLRGRRAANAPRTVASSTSAVPRGAAALLWKRLIFLRRKHGARLALGTLALGIAVGTSAGLVAIHDPSAAQSLLTMLLLLLALIPFYNSASLGTDLARPLWWMGDGTVANRLAWDTLGSVAGIQTFGVTVYLVAGAIERNPVVLVGGSLAAIVLPFAIRAVGVFAYTLSPSAVDQRGPAMMVRVFVLYGTIIVSGLAGIGVLVLTQSPAAAIGAGSLVLAALGYGALALGARRVERLGVELARAESL
ncbi:MAG: hypothetical protein KGN02_04970 [bacterium]|nr:hypothetical protein [bacterium]